MNEGARIANEEIYRQRLEDQLERIEKRFDIMIELQRQLLFQATRENLSTKIEGVSTEIINEK